MDFGLDKLVEMIEERFGRFWGTVVLLALMLAAFAIAVHAVFEYLILPVFREGPPLLFQIAPAWKRLTLADASYAALQIAIGLLGALVFLAVAPLITRRVRARAQDAVNDARKVLQDCEARSEHFHAELDKRFLELTALREEFKAEVLDFKMRHDLLPNEGSDSQPPPDTGSEKQP